MRNYLKLLSKTNIISVLIISMATLGIAWAQEKNPLLSLLNEGPDQPVTYRHLACLVEDNVRNNNAPENFSGQSYQLQLSFSANGLIYVDQIYYDQANCIGGKTINHVVLSYSVIQIQGEWIELELQREVSDHPMTWREVLKVEQDGQFIYWSRRESVNEAIADDLTKTPMNSVPARRQYENEAVSAKISHTDDRPLVGLSPR